MRALPWILLLTTPILAQEPTPEGIRLVQTIAAKGKAGRAVVFVDQDRQLVTIAAAGVESWNLGTGAKVHTWPGDFQAIAATPDGNGIAALDDKDDVHLFDVLSHREEWKLRFTGDILAPQDGSLDTAILSFSPNGKLLAIGCRKDIEIWDVDSRSFSHRFGPGWGNRLGVLDFFPDNRHIARTGLPTYAVAIWDTSSHRNTDTFRGVRYIRAGRLAPDGEAFAAGTDRTDNDNVVQFLRIGGRHDLLVSVSAPVNSLAYSPDGRIVAVRTIDGKILLLHRKSLQTAGTIEVAPVEGDVRPLGLAFSASGKQLAADQGDRISVWDLTAVRRKFAGYEKLTRKQLETAWEELARPVADDNWIDVAAVHQLIGVPEQSIPLLAEKVRVPGPVAPGVVGRLIAELDDDVFNVRERATKALLDLDGLGKSILVDRLRKSVTLEQKLRMEMVLEATRRGATDRHRRDYRAVWIAYIIGSPAAMELLRKWAGGDPDAFLTVEARNRLMRAEKAKNGS